MNKLLLIGIVLLLLPIVHAVAPTVDTVTISPTTPIISDNLIGTVTVTDPEGDNITIDFNWYKDGVLDATTLIDDALFYYPLNLI